MVAVENIDNPEKEDMESEDIEEEAKRMERGAEGERQRKERIEGKEKKEEQEKKERLERKERKNRIEHEKSQEILNTQVDLEELKVLVEQGILSQKLFESIKEGKTLEDNEIQEIFEKIDEIENIQNVEEMIPKDFRITKEEYIAAKNNQEKRQQVLDKLNDALSHISTFSHGGDVSGLDLFSGLYLLFNKNLRMIQENTIDIKDSLED